VASYRKKKSKKILLASDHAGFELKEAIKRYGSVDSGRSLPFAELPDTLKKKVKKEEK